MNAQPNPTDELREALIDLKSFGSDFHYERKKLIERSYDKGGSDPDVESALETIHAHMKAVLRDVIGPDDPRSTDARGTVCNSACHATAVNLSKAEQRKTAAKWLPKEKQ